MPQTVCFQVSACEAWRHSLIEFEKIPRLPNELPAIALIAEHLHLEHA